MLKKNMIILRWVILKKAKHLGRKMVFLKASNQFIIASEKTILSERNQADLSCYNYF